MTYFSKKYGPVRTGLHRDDPLPRVAVVSSSIYNPPYTPVSSNFIGTTPVHFSYFFAASFQQI